jgi:hypothetical protein
LEKPLWRFYVYCAKEIDELLSVIEQLTESKKDTPVAVVDILLGFLKRIRPMTKEAQQRVRAFCNRMVGKVNRLARRRHRSSLACLH